MPKRFTLGLGSNLGEKKHNLETAFREISELPQTKILARAPIYVSEPWGDLDQDAFLNTAAMIETPLSPRALLDQLKNIETKMGRQKTRIWGPRQIDIDILTWEGGSFIDDRLTIPHPGVTQRAFVLEPLAQICPDLEIDGQSVREHLRKLPRSPNDARLM